MTGAADPSGRRRPRPDGRRRRQAGDRAARRGPRGRAAVARRPRRGRRPATRLRATCSAWPGSPGIQAAKRTAELIPLCHPLALSFVGVEGEVDADAGTVALTAEARTTGQTGVEMEAMTAASVAALTVYDMVKGLERGAEIA